MRAARKIRARHSNVCFRNSLRANKHARHRTRKLLIGKSCNAARCIYTLCNNSNHNLSNSSKVALGLTRELQLVN